jgi:hypothetical protein
VCDTLLFVHDKKSTHVFVPRAVQPVLLQEFHDTPVSGHMGVVHTHNAMFCEGMHRALSPFKPGDLVYLSTKNILFNTPSKLTSKFVGPFKILELHAHGHAVHLFIPAVFKACCMHDVCNVCLLNMNIDCSSEMGSQHVHHLPPLADTPQGPLWEVESVVKMAYCNGQKRVLVCWKGYSPAGDL